ncbi:MAG: hypothetical protein ABJG78_11955 [Cyclobacteriaceae bacterium]
MDYKKSIVRLAISLLVSPAVVYIFLVVSGMFGASYEMTHGETWIIWLLMAIVVNLSITKKP